MSYDLVTKVEGANGTETELVIARKSTRTYKSQPCVFVEIALQEGEVRWTLREKVGCTTLHKKWLASATSSVLRAVVPLMSSWTTPRKRWKSTPANIKLFNQTHRAVWQNLVGDSENVQNMMVTHDRLKTDVEVLKVKLEGSSKEVQDLANQFEEFQSKGGGNLPPFVQSMSSKMIHFNISLVATSPPMTWRTKCGWHYSGS